MKILFFLIFCFELFAQSACIYQGADVLCLKSNLKFQTSLNRIATGNAADPTVTATAGIPGDLYIRTTGQHYIKSDSGTTINWSPVFTGVPAGGGDVVGPGVATDNAFALYDGTTGKLIKNSTVTTTTITGMQTDITTLQTDLTTAETNITNLQTDMTTAQGDITTIQGDITTLQGSAITVPTCLAGEFNTSDGTNFVCATPAGGGGAGDVVGPGLAVDNGVALFDGTTGKLIKDSAGLSFSNGDLAITSTPPPEIVFSTSGGGFDTLISLTIPPNLGFPLNYTLTLPGTEPAANQILQSDAAGNLSWINTPAGGAATVVEDNLTSISAVNALSANQGRILDNKITPLTAASHTHANKVLLDTLTSAGAGTSFLADDGTYKVPAGGGGAGDVVGPTSSAGTFGSVYPAMTSNATPAGYVASGHVNAWHMFDKTIGSLAGWTLNVPAILQIPTSSVLDSYAINPGTFSNTGVAWTVAGSNDGTTWTVLDTKTGQSLTGNNVPVTYTLSSPSLSPFSRFRLNFTAENANGQSAVFADNFEYFSIVGKTFIKDKLAIYADETGKLITYPSYTFPLTDGSSGYVLKTNGGGSVSWQADNTGAGAVIGPGTSTDNAIALFDGGTGALIKQDRAAGLRLSYDAPAQWDKELNFGNANGGQNNLNITAQGSQASTTVNSAGSQARFAHPGGAVINITAAPAGNFISLGAGAASLDSGILFTSNNLQIAFKAPIAHGTYNMILPAAGPAANQILQSDAAGQLSWINTPGGGGTGDVVGPAGSPNETVALFSGLTGKLIKYDTLNFETTNKTLFGLNVITLGANGGNGLIGFSDPNNGNIVSIGSALPIQNQQYTIRLPSAAPVADQIMQSDSTGQLVWINTPTGGGGGGGDVIGPAVSVDETIPVFAGTSGKNIKDTVLGFQTASNTLYGMNRIQISGTNDAIISLNDWRNGEAVNIKTASTITNTGYDIRLPNVAPTNNQILQAQAGGQLSWINTPAAGGTGDVVGPGVSVDGDLAIFSGTTGKLIKKVAGTTVSTTGSMDLSGSTARLTMSLGSRYMRLNPAAPGNTIEMRSNSSGVLNINQNDAQAVNYSITYPGVAPAASQILQSDATGQLSWINTPAGAAAPPTCTGSQRLTGNGTVLSCVNNTYQVPAALAIDWATAHVFYKSVSAAQTFTFSNQANGQVIILAVENTSGSDVIVVFPTSNWAGGVIGGTVKATSKTLFTFARINNQNYVTSVENMK